MTLRMRRTSDSPVVATYHSVRDEDIDFEEMLARLEAPSARFLEAVAVFLAESARRGDVRLPTTSIDEDALRRLGFVADRLSARSELDIDVRRRLGRFAKVVWSRLPSEAFDDLGLSKRTTEGRIRRLKSEADDIDQRWRVWGEVSLRTEFLG